MKTKSLSLAEPITEDFEEVYKPKRKFIMKQIVIDKFTTKRLRVELTPSVCDVCGLDLAVVNKFKNYAQVPDDEKPKIEKAVEKHKETVHTISEQLIVTEDRMPTAWLGRETSL